MHKIILWFTGLIFAANTSFAADIDVSTHVSTLDNGLKLIVKEDHRAPVGVVQIWYKVGSADEPGGLTGLSHVLEHLMFKGTKKHPSGSFSRMISRQGGQENAWTNRDYTMYFTKISADKIPLVLELEADRMQNLQFNPEEFKKEMQVVMEERRMRVDDNPQALTYERLQASAHLSSPYHHTPIGWMDDLINLKMADAKQWYQKWYAPNNAIIVITGDVNPQQMKQTVDTYFGNIQPSTLPSAKPQREPKPLGTRKVEVERPAKMPIVFMAYNVPSRITAKDPKAAYALSVAAGILSGGSSARFSANLIRKQQIATEADADYNLFSRFSPLFTLQGVPSKGKSVDMLIHALEAQVKQLATVDVTPEELARVKTQVIAAKIYQQDSMFGTAYALGLLELTGIGWQEVDRYIDAINAVTAKDVKSAVTQYLTPHRLTIAVLKPRASTGESS